MNDWLDADPDAILGDVMSAKWMTGENVADGDAARRAVAAEIARAQADLRDLVEAGPDGRLLLYREISATDAWLDALAPGDALGECWAFERAGAHGYDARKGVRRVLTAWAEPGDVAWPHVLAMWSSGEGEARLDARAQVELSGIADRDGTARRPDLAGAAFGTGRPMAAAPGLR